MSRTYLTELFWFACVFAALEPRIAWATNLEIRVMNVADSAGSVRIVLCTETQWLTPRCSVVGRAPSHRGVVVVTVPNVQPGIYGVIAHHDSKNDGTIHRNLFGIPTDGVGFSRDAPLRFGPPRFDDAKIPIAGERVTTEITLSFERAG